MIPFAAMSVVIASCAQVKAPVSAESSSASAASTKKVSSSAKSDSAAGGETSLDSSGSSVAASRANAGASSSGVTLPPLPDMGDGFDDAPLPVGPLPGDLRGNLRTPDMPSSLPMSVDGKINSSDF